MTGGIPVNMIHQAGIPRQLLYCTTVQTISTREQALNAHPTTHTWRLLPWTLFRVYIVFERCVISQDMLYHLQFRRIELYPSSIIRVQNLLLYCEYSIQHDDSKDSALSTAVACRLVLRLPHVLSQINVPTCQRGSLFRVPPVPSYCLCRLIVLVEQLPRMRHIYVSVLTWAAIA